MERRGTTSRLLAHRAWRGRASHGRFLRPFRDVGLMIPAVESPGGPGSPTWPATSAQGRAARAHGDTAARRTASWRPGRTATRRQARNPLPPLGPDRFGFSAPDGRGRRWDRSRSPCGDPAPGSWRSHSCGRTGRSTSRPGHAGAAGAWSGSVLRRTRSWSDSSCEFRYPSARRTAFQPSAATMLQRSGQPEMGAGAVGGPGWDPRERPVRGARPGFASRTGDPPMMGPDGRFVNRTKVAPADWPLRLARKGLPSGRPTSMVIDARVREVSDP